MSEGIEILISADDQASAKLKEVADNMEDAAKQQVAAFKEVGGRAKGATEFVGMLASLTGNSELAGYAGQLAQVTDKAGQFSEIQKAGGAGALAFKGGLVALTGTLAVGLGKALGDVIFQTEKFNRSMANAKQTSTELLAQISKTQATEFTQRQDDIELISDPATKRAAQQQFLEELNRDIAAVSGNVRASKKAVEEWANAWPLITGERKAAAAMATEELASDKARLAALTEQRQEIIAMTSERTKQNEALKIENAEKQKSKDYLKSLRQEIELLTATKKERLSIQAAIQASASDHSKALELLRQRELLQIKELKKAELERQQVQRLAIEIGREAAQVQGLVDKGFDQATAKMIAAEDAKLQLAEEIKASRMKAEEAGANEGENWLRAMGMDEAAKKSIAEQLQLRRIAIDQGKEAAKVQELINQGIDRETAKRFAREDVKLTAAEEDKERQKMLAKGEVQSLQATQGRLLSRGSGMDKSVADEERKRQLAEIDKNLKVQNELQREAIRALKSGGKLQVEFVA